eukprot:403345238
MKVNYLQIKFRQSQNLPFKHPNIFRIGDIIRVNRVNCQKYDNQIDLINDKQTSWAIFSGNPDYQHSYEHEKSDFKLNVNYFKNYEELSNLVKITESAEEELQLLNYQKSQYGGAIRYKDFDILALLIQVQLIKATEAKLLLKDVSGKVYDIIVDITRHKIPQEGEIVRIRSACLIKPPANYSQPIQIMIENHSNILHIPQMFKQAKIFKEKIQENEVFSQLMISSQNDNDTAICLKPFVVTKVSKQYSKMNFSNFTEIHHHPNDQQNSDLNPQQNNTFRVMVQTLDFLPSNLEEIIQFQCPNCMKLYSQQQFVLSSSKNFCFCIPAGVSCQQIYTFTLIVKDQSTLYDDQCFKLQYSSFGQTQAQLLFSGLNVTNLSKDLQAKYLVEMCQNTFTKFNVHLDLIIQSKYCENEGVNVFQIVDGRVKPNYLEYFQNQQLYQQQEINNEFDKLNLN